MFLFIGILIGLVLGLTGAGGSVFAVPLLMIFGGLPMSYAVGISLGAVAVSTIFGCLRNYHGNNILWFPGFLLAGSGAITAPLGKSLGMKIPELWLLLGFSVLAITIGVRMWLSASLNSESTKVVRAGTYLGSSVPGSLRDLNPIHQFILRPRYAFCVLVGGALVGLLSGLFGVGGGFLIVPLLLILNPISMAQAVSTSLLVIAVISSSGFISHLHISTNNDWRLFLMVALGGALGMMIGQTVSHKIANATLQKVFSISLIIVSLTTLAKYFL